MNKLVLIQQELEESGESARLPLAINDIQHALAESVGQYENFYGEQASRCGSGKQLLEDFIAKLHDDQTAIQAGIDQTRSIFEVYGESGHAQGQQLEKAREELGAIGAEVKAAVDELREYGIEAEGKLVTIKFLRDIITDELLNQAEKGASFVQLKTFNAKLKELKDMLQKSHDSKFAPLVTTLLTLAEQRGFSDQGLLSQILNTLDKLSESIKEFRATQEDAGKKNIENLKALGANKATEIKDLAHSIADSNSRLKNAGNNMQRLEGEIKLLESEIHRKRGELKYFTEICEYQDQLHKKRTEERLEVEGLVSDATNAAFA